MSDELEKDLELDLDEGLDLEQPTDNEEVEELKRQLAEKDSIISQQNARLKQTKKPQPIKSKAYDDEIVQDVQFLKTLEAKRQYGYEQGLSPEETDFVFKFAGGKPDKDILENPFVKSGLEGFRASKKIADNTPSASGSSPVFGNKSFSDLSEDERREAFEKRMGR